MPIGTSVVTIVLIVGGAIALFILLRALVLWYFRVNEIVQLLKDIRGRLGAPSSEPIEPVVHPPAWGREVAPGSPGGQPPAP